jgi:hypothetical protein
MAGEIWLKSDSGVNFVCAIKAAALKITVSLTIQASFCIRVLKPLFPKSENPNEIPDTRSWSRFYGSIHPQI